MIPLDDQIRNEQIGWGASESLDYYRSHRSNPEDLYDSERFFLPDLLPQVDSVLDVGCAAGGFSRIMRSFNPALRYAGVDITPELIEAARRDYPDCEFQISDGVNLPFQRGTFDLVHCSGVLHLNSHYQEMVASMWAQTRRFLLCDFRLTRESSKTGEIEVRFDENTQVSRLPYYVLNIDELLDFLTSLTPVPGFIRANGYSHSVSSTARVPVDHVLMAFFILEKGTGGPPRLDLQFSE